MDLGDLRAVSSDARAAQVLLAYQAGLFPMGIGERGEGPIGWWAPERRGVLLPGDLHVSHSLTKSLRRFAFTIDETFSRVIDACADACRDGAWITPHIRDLYVELHEMGQAHSVEVWFGDELVGGLYGIGIGGLFAGESMFHSAPDASKAALVHLVRTLEGVSSRGWLIDTQWLTPHLATLGVSEVSGLQYLRLLEAAKTHQHTQAFLTGR